MRGILLDRDGVINRERADYVKCWSEFEFLPGVLQALGRLTHLQVPILVITNQSVIGRKIVNRKIIDQIHQNIHKAINAGGGRIDDFFVCPHHPDEHCRCRKPAPGLLLQAAERYNLKLSESVFIGDSITDYQAAMAVGCQSILVESGRQGPQLHDYFTDEIQANMSHSDPSHHAIPQPQLFSSTLKPPIVCDLAEAVNLLLNNPEDTAFCTRTTCK